LPPVALLTMSTLFEWSPAARFVSGSAPRSSFNGATRPTVDVQSVPHLSAIPVRVRVTNTVHKKIQTQSGCLTLREVPVGGKVRYRGLGNRPVLTPLSQVDRLTGIRFRTSSKSHSSGSGSVKSSVAFMMSSRTSLNYRGAVAAIVKVTYFRRKPLVGASRKEAVTLPKQL
jgi:hypothetical protein